MEIGTSPATAHGATPVVSRDGAIHLVAALCVLAATAVLLATREPPRPLVERLATPSPYHALIVLQASDCESNVGFLGLFDRPDLSGSYRAQALVVGGEPLPEGIAGRLGAVEVGRASESELRFLAGLGLRETPFVVVLDSAGAVRFSFTTPRSSSEANRVLGILLNLTGPAVTSGGREGADA